MLPEGYVLNIIRKYNARLLYWDVLLIFLSVFPALHQSGKPEYIANWDYLALAVFAMIALNNLFKYLIWNSKPVLHPVSKCLAKHGDPEELAAHIDKDAAKSGIGLKFPVLVAESWIIYQGPLKIRMIPVRQIVWYYRKDPGPKAAKSGKASLVVFTSDQKVHILKFRQTGDIENPAYALSKTAPWAFSGYSQKLVLRWKEKRKGMIDAAMARLEALKPEEARDRLF